ncbi:MAG: type I-C CRISPR-associated protein Cas8c/Csd1 [Aristaeellaceae bacterium]
MPGEKGGQGHARESLWRKAAELLRPARNRGGDMMGLLQKTMETYDAMEGLAGVYEEGKEPLAPVGHMVTRTQIEITITADGHLTAARAADKEQKIIIPVTEDSAGRTSAPAAHSLCEQLGYLSGRDEEKFQLYMEGLERWVQSEQSHPKAAVWAYVGRRTVLADLAAAAISCGKEKDMVCWRVTGLGAGEDTAVWRDRSLMKAYTAFYLSQLDGDKQVCLLTGQTGFVTWKHMPYSFNRMTGRMPAASA